MTRSPAPTPPYKALHLFVRAAQGASFAEVAVAFGITPSAVSHQIKTLEAWVGAPLFDRSTRTPTLTPLGKVLLDGAGAAAGQIDRVATAVRRASSSGRVVVSAPPAFAAYRFLPALGDLRRGLPGIEIDLRTTTYNATVETDVVDLAIRFLHGTEPEHATRLGVAGWSAVCTREHLEHLGRPGHVRDLRHAVLVHEADFNFWPGCLAACGVRDAPGLRYIALGDALGTLSAALSGRAVALSPREVTSDLRRRGLLVSIPGGDVEPDAAFRAIPTQTGGRKETVRRIIAALNEALA